MGKSYRRPYSSPTGVRSASWDKREAARGLRRLHNCHLKTHWAEEDLLMPHRLEAHHNDVWGWSRDGKQRLQVPPDRATREMGWYLNRDREGFDHWYEHRLQWFKSLQRK